MSAFAKFWIVVNEKQGISFDTLIRFRTEKEARDCAEQCSYHNPGKDYYVLSSVARCSKASVRWEEATDGAAPF